MTQVYFLNLHETPRQLAALCRQAGIDHSVPDVKAVGRQCEQLGERLLWHRIFNTSDPLRHDADGRPLAPDGDSRHISLSHTRHLLCAAVGESRLGIDVEYTGPRVLRVREKFLHPDELAAIPPDNIAANLTAWTAKEALYKAAERQHGIDLCEDLRLGACPVAEMQKTGTLTLEHALRLSFSATCRGEEYSLTSLLWSGYVLTVAQPAGSGSPVSFHLPV